MGGALKRRNIGKGKWGVDKGDTLGAHKERYACKWCSQGVGVVLEIMLEVTEE